MELKRVVVTGLGAITPIGNTVPEFWKNCVDGVSGAGSITHFDASKFKTQFACPYRHLIRLPLFFANLIFPTFLALIWLL